MTGKRKKMLAKLLAFGLGISLLMPAAMVAEAGDGINSDVQIVQTGEKIYYLASGEEASADNFDVWTSKTIAGTDKEDEFEITLQVGSTVKAVPDDVAVVLVMDVSGSMNQNAYGQYYEYYYGPNNYKQVEDKKRIDYAKEAAEAFVTNLVAGAGDRQRMVSIVEFGNNAKTVLDWTDANQNGQLNPEVKNAIDDVKINFVYDQKEVSAKLKEATLVSSVSSGDVVSGGNVVTVKYCLYTDEDGNKCPLTEEHGHCKICGLVEAHQHCTYEGCDKTEEHTHTEDVYDGDTLSGPMTDRVLQSIQKIATNMEGGLMLTRNLLNKGLAENGPIEGIDNVYVILLSDGQPTAYVASRDYSADETGFAIGTIGEGTYDGSFTNWEDIEDIVYSGGEDDIAIAEDIKKEAGLFTILYGYEGEQKLGYSWRGKHTDHILAETSVKDWLTGKEINYVGVDRIFSSVEIDGLNSIFDEINDRIDLLSKAWVVTDEMGSIQLGDDVSFEGFTLNGEYAEATQATAAVNSTITWKLGSMEPESGCGGIADPYIYTLKYKVTLNSSSETVKKKSLAYEESNQGSAVLTNNAATLQYLQVGKNELDKMDNDDIAANLKTAAFSKPSVKGLYGDYTFVKKNQETGAVIEGAGFVLYDADGNACTDEVFSDANGNVKFENIPKGEYRLAETSVPEGMQSLEPIKLKVAWGAVSTLEGEAMPGVIYNVPDKTEEIPKEEPTTPAEPETPDESESTEATDEPEETDDPEETKEPEATNDSDDTDDSEAWVEIEEPSVPQAAVPESNKYGNLAVLEDPMVPLSKAPRTGDSITIWLTMFVLSSMGLAAGSFMGRKRHENKK